MLPEELETYIDVTIEEFTTSIPSLATRFSLRELLTECARAGYLIGIAPIKAPVEPPSE